jgi:hypothetical protein
MSNWGLKKRLLAEVDVFQIDQTHELYAHMNINYVRSSGLPGFDQYGELLRTMKNGNFFISTGEVLMPEHSIKELQPGKLRASADVRYTLPLQFAEVVWGDGEKTYRDIQSLESTREFGAQTITLDVNAPTWHWARIAVWDVAGNGAFANPVWNSGHTLKPDTID